MRPSRTMSTPRDDPAPHPVDGVDVGALAQAYGRLVFHAAWRVLGNDALAEEVQQDVFMRLLEHPPARVDSWPAFLTTMAMRQAIDHQRRRHRWQRVRMLWRGSSHASAPSAEQVLSGSEAAGRLRQAIVTLKPREAECFVLRHLQGLAVGAIAEQLGITPNHASVCLHRARRALQAALAEQTTEVSP